MANENWTDISKESDFYNTVDTNVLNEEEKKELDGSSITQEDLAKHPEEVKEIARFSMNLKLSSRQSVDTFIHDS